MKAQTKYQEREKYSTENDTEVISLTDQLKQKMPICKIELVDEMNQFRGELVTEERSLDTFPHLKCFSKQNL